MRTTVTLDADTARALKSITERDRRAFKDVLNEVIRVGLATIRGNKKNQKFTLRAKHCGFKSGVDPTKLNQLLDEIAENEFMDNFSTPRKNKDS